VSLSQFGRLFMEGFPEAIATWKGAIAVEKSHIQQSDELTR
jgi:hypothetical protein